jgi:hypothetical protein
MQSYYRPSPLNCPERSSRNDNGRGVGKGRRAVAAFAIPSTLRAGKPLTRLVWTPRPGRFSKTRKRAGIRISQVAESAELLCAR